MKHTYTKEEKERIAQMLFDFFREHKCFGGEHFAQDVKSQIDLVDIKDVTEKNMDWNKLKKAIIYAISILGGLAILLACIAGIDYIALTHPIIAISIAVGILFCVLVILCY